MKKIFLFTVIIASFITCSDHNEKNDEKSMLGPIPTFLIRLVDTQGNWIEGIEEKEMQLFVADSNWNILKEQPDNTPGAFYFHPLWRIKKRYNYVGNGKEEFIGGKKELLSIEIFTFLSVLSYNPKNDETFGEYLVLQIDENTSLNIQLVHKEFFNHVGPCIEKFICNGIEYINIESIPNYRNGEDAAGQQKINDIVIE